MYMWLCYVLFYHGVGNHLRKRITVGTREDKTQTRQSDCSCIYMIFSAFIIRIHLVFTNMLWQHYKHEVPVSKHLVLMNIEHSVLAFQLNDLF